MQGELGKGFLIAQSAYQLSRYGSEAIIMVLATMFGQRITTKSTYLQNGACQIIGVDQHGKECFSFQIKSGQEDDADGSSDSDGLGSWDRASMFNSVHLMRTSQDSVEDKASFYS